MVCIFCQNETQVTNSRYKAKSPSVWRRRACKVCVAQFSTLELPDYAKALDVLSQPAKKPAPFNRDKLYLSIYKSLGHRADALDAATALTATIIGRLLRKGKVSEHTLQINVVAKTTYEVLKRFDPAGANVYKTYHRNALRA